jgi:hypothetical protein
LAARFPTPSRPMDAAQTQLWSAGWSRRQRAAVCALGLLMLYLHSLYILAFYVPEEEYWFPFWTGLTVVDRLLSLGLAFIANFALLATSFLRTPGRWMRMLLAVSLCCGIRARPCRQPAPGRGACPVCRGRDVTGTGSSERLHPLPAETEPGQRRGLAADLVRRQAVVWRTMPWTCACNCGGTSACVARAGSRSA